MSLSPGHAYYQLEQEQYRQIYLPVKQNIFKDSTGMKKNIVQRKKTQTLIGMRTRAATSDTPAQVI